MRERKGKPRSATPSTLTRTLDPTAIPHAVLDLARCTGPAAPVRASAAAIILASRAPAGSGAGAGSVATREELAAAELAGGLACLEALAEVPLPEA